MFSFIVTKHHPWTTIDSSIRGTALEILHLCPVKLVFLGDNRYGRLWRKIVPTRPVSTHQTGLLPIFPDAQLILQEPAPVSRNASHHAGFSAICKHPLITTRTDSVNGEPNK